MNMIQRGVGLVVLGSVMALSAASVVGFGSGSGSSGSQGSSSSTVSMRSMMGRVPGDGASDPGYSGAGVSEFQISEKGMLFYIEEGSESLIPWVCNNREMLVMAIRRSARGQVLGQAPNVFYVNREWFKRLNDDAEGRPAKLYYVVEGTSPLDLFTCEKQSLVAQAIVDCGCSRLPHQAANVFSINTEWGAILKTAGVEGCDDLASYVIEGDSEMNPIYNDWNIDLVNRAINKSGFRHVTSHSDVNVYWINKLEGDALKVELSNWKAQRDAEQRRRENNQTLEKVGVVVGGAAWVAAGAFGCNVQ